LFVLLFYLFLFILLWSLSLKKIIFIKSHTHFLIFD